jgi:hypothetical protein
MQLITYCRGHSGRVATCLDIALKVLGLNPGQAGIFPQVWGVSESTQL